MIPRPVVASSLQKPILGDLLPTDVGYFPRAAGHLRSRAIGAEQAVLIYCVRGKGWCEMKGLRHEVGPGTLLVVPPGVPHRYGSQDDDPWTIHWVHAAGRNIPSILSTLGCSAEQPLRSLLDDAQALVLFQEILDTLEGGYAPTQLLYAALTLSHLMGVLILHGCEPHPAAIRGGQKIDAAIRYMEQHLHLPLSVGSLAAMVNLSASHFSALFKKESGYAVMDYFTRLRMHKASQLLDTTDLSVKEIALRVGYADALYFSRVFRIVHDLAPQHYRNSRKG